jgi:hypothetical protein
MTTYKHYTPQEIQSILEEHEPGVRGKGLKTLAKQHNIKGGHNLIKYWLSKWDGTVKSLEGMGGGDRRSILTDQEKKKHVDRFITKRSKKDAVQYPEVKANIENKTGKDISIQTVRRIGHELGHSSKKVKRLLESEGMFRSPFPYELLLDTEDFKENVAGFRRKCQRVDKNRLVFIDGTGMRSEPRKLRALAPRGTTPRVKAEKHEKYEPRVDMWGAIAYSGPLVCQTLTSQQRKKVVNERTKKKGVKGYTKSLVKKFLKTKLAPKIKELKGVPILCMDKGLAFKEEEVKEAVHDGGATNLQDVWLFPTNTAKFVSPLDNNLWHGLKGRVRARNPATENGTARILQREFMATQSKEIKNYYRHCSLTTRTDPYQDLMD